jgi:integrase/recombinase XerD
MHTCSGAAPAPPKRILIAECIPAFLLDPGKNKLGKHTIRAYRRILNAFRAVLDKKFPDVVYIDQLTPVHVLEYLELLSDQGRSASTRAQAYSALRSCLDFAWRSGYLRANVVRELERPSLGEHLPLLPSNNALARMLECECGGAWPAREAVIREMLLFCGPSELVSLDVEDIDLEAATVVFSRRGYGQPHPMGEYLSDALDTYLTERLARLRSRGVEAPESIRPLFLGGSFRKTLQARLTTRTLQRIVRRMAEETGVKLCTPKTLRFAHGVDIVGQGADLDVVRQLVGRKGLSAVERMKKVADDKKDMLDKNHPMAKGPKPDGRRA